MKQLLTAYWMPKSGWLCARLQWQFQERQPFLPLDVESPQERNCLIIQEAKPDFLCTLDGTLPILPPGCRAELDASDSHHVKWGLTWSEAGEGIGRVDDLAYILYTSGSTGMPKGVQITRKNADAFLNWAAHELPLKKDDVVASIAPFHFDLSVYDLHLSSKVGARVYIPTGAATRNPRLMAAELSKAQVTSMYCTPTFLQLLVNHGRVERQDWSALRQILFAGEPYPTAALRRAMEVWPDVAFHNLYGPTETNVIAHYALRREALPEDKVPIGRGASGANLMLSEDGELWASGPSVSPGYLSGHCVDRWVVRDGMLWYKTGDRVSLRENQYVFEGRMDRMVKRRGYRIEPAEIERVYSDAEDIEEAICILSKSGLALVYRLCRESDQDLTFDQMMAIGRKGLPAYMLPDMFGCWRGAWPMTSNGKLDQARLHQIF